MEQLLTVREAAGYLRVSQATLWRWCQEGRVPAFKIGHEWRVVTPALQRLVAAGGAADAAGADVPADAPSSSSDAESPSAGS
jgi:excisionase family DNA binding protein